MSADELKAKGNECFKARNFAEAAQHYTSAIAADPSSAVLYSNRSGAYYELKQFDKAIADGKKSLSLAPTAKAHSRIGAALWAQNKFPAALEAYEAALALSPSDATAKENVSKLRAKIASSAAGTGGRAAPAPALAGDKADAGLDLLIIFLGGIQVIGSIIMPAYAALLWKALMAAMIARSALILKRQGLLRPTLEAVKAFASNFAGQYLVLCTVMLVAPVPPMPALIFAICAYALVDMACSQRGATLELLPLLAKFEGRLDAVRTNRDGLLVNAAMCEIGAALMAMLTGNFMYGMLLLQFFLKYRYRTDQYAKYAWGFVGQGLGKLFYHPRCPPALTSVFEKARDGMYAIATR